jgi:hypothetical protein
MPHHRGFALHKSLQIPLVPKKIGISVLLGVLAHAKNGAKHFRKEKFHAANGKKV